MLVFADGGRQFDDKTAGDWRRDDGGGGGGFSSNRMDDKRDNRGFERRWMFFKYLEL